MQNYIVTIRLDGGDYAEMQVQARDADHALVVARGLGFAAVKSRLAS